MNAPTTLDAQQELTVTVGGQRLALRASRVLEVIRRPKATRVPLGPPALVGVFNLRGAVVPMISLARLLGVEAGPEQNVVVLENGGPVGVLVDAVPHLGRDRQGAEARQLDLAILLEAGFKRPVNIGSQARTVGHRPDVVAQPETKRVLVSFVVNAQTFALPLSAVMEIRRLPDEIARVARADQAVLGVVNLRNRSLPVLSLAGLLGFPEMDTGREGRPVLVVDHHDCRVGLVADSVTSVLRLDEAAIDKVPAVLQRGTGAAELDAIGRTSTQTLVSILSVPKLFADPSLKEAFSAQTQEDAPMVLDQDAADKTQKYLIFDLGDERYGVSVGAVDEVLRLPDVVTRLPNGPQFVTGIINLRGRPVPLIDQRQRFDVPSADTAVRPRVIIMTVGRLQAGFVVDAASDIIAVASCDIAAAPQLSTSQSALFKHVANVDDKDGKLILIVDPEELLTRAEQDAIAQFTKTQVHAGAR